MLVQVCALFRQEIVRSLTKVLSYIDSPFVAMSEAEEKDLHAFHELQRKMIDNTEKQKIVSFGAFPGQACMTDPGFISSLALFLRGLCTEVDGNFRPSSNYKQLSKLDGDQISLSESYQPYLTRYLRTKRQEKRRSQPSDLQILISLFLVQTIHLFVCLFKTHRHTITCGAFSLSVSV